MSDIQNIAITSTQTVPQPKPHTTYTIQVSTPTRTWDISRRYNDFVALDAELRSSAGKEPPLSLPGKHMWSLTRSVYDEKTIRERRVLLENYLRTILTTKDPRWRSAYTFQDFLGYKSPARTGSASNPSSSSAADPSSSSATAAGIPPPPDTFTSSNWLSELTALQSLVRLIRASLLKRDALAGMSDAQGARSSGVEAKRLLKDLGLRLDGLERGLGGLKGLGAGETRRREEMVEGLKVEKSNLGRMAEAGVRTATSAFAPLSTTNPGGGSGHGVMPGGSTSLFAPTGSGPATGRVFGRSPGPPAETSETRPLDDRGLIQLQQNKVSQQDEQLGELSKVLLRQRKMGEEIHQEIGEQNEMLDDLETRVDQTGGKLARTKRQMNRLG